MQHALQAQPSVLRHRDGYHAKVTFEEPFFDLVSVFAVTQISHALLHHLSWAGLIAGGGLVGLPWRKSGALGSVER